MYVINSINKYVVKEKSNIVTPMQKEFEKLFLQEVLSKLFNETI